MSHARLRARAPRGRSSWSEPATDPDTIARFLEDAAHFPGGHAAGVVHPASEADVAAVIRRSTAVLPVGAQSSLTGGATPMGEVVISTARMNRILAVGDGLVRAEAGVTLLELDAALARDGRSYPPAPTFTGAFVGGIVSTNAAGAATFKYGTTRSWVQAITVVLPCGDVLDVRRGETAARGSFAIELTTGATLDVPLPRYRLPGVPKASAGYFSSDPFDPIDLWIGAEGTLGVITEVTLRILPSRPPECVAFVPFRARTAALAFVQALRTAAQTTWRRGDPLGIDISAIEHVDARCLALLREDGVDETLAVRWPPDTSIALIVTLELPSSMSAARAYDEIGRTRDASAADTPLGRFCRMLDAAGVFDQVEIAAPGDRRRAVQLLALREAVPAAVNQRVGRAKQTDGRIEKTAADMIVPFDRLGELLRIYDDEFERRGLDAAVWGHVSDGNLHPNVIPRTFADVEAGREAIGAFGRAAMAMGGSPLAEHGVGRNPLKQQLLRNLYGDDGIAQMRAVKQAIDPEWKLAPGVILRKENGRT